MSEPIRASLPSLIAAICLVLVIPCMGQQSPATQPPPGGSYNVSVSSSVTTPPSVPPTAKYLVASYPPLNGKPQKITITVSKDGKAVTDLTNFHVGDQNLTVAAKSDSGLPVTISIQPGPAALSKDNKLTLNGAGKVALVATQAGNNKYTPAALSQEFNVLATAGMMAQKITFAPIPQHYVGDQPFAVRATSDSGLPVTISVKSGPATISNNILTLTGDGGDTVILQADQPGNERYAATTATQTYKISANESCSPGLIPQKPQTPTESGSSANNIIALLGSPDPFSFQLLGTGRIMIYSSRFPLDVKDQDRLSRIESVIDSLWSSSDVLKAGASPASPSPANSPAQAGNSSGSQPAKPAYTLEVRIPHAAALGDLAAKISPLSSGTFTVQDVGTNKIRITSQSVPSCHDITQFLKDIHDVAWQVHPESPVDQVFHLQASDITAVINSGSGSSSGAGAPSTPSNTNQAAAAPSGQASQQGSGQSSGGAAPATNSGTNSSNSTSTQNGSNTAAGSSTSSNVSASSSASNAANSANGQTSSPGGSGAASPSSNSSSTAPKGSANTPSSVTVAGIPPDFLLFNDTNPGDDAGITEKKRLIALLDIPRPEMLINVWSMQTTQGDGKRAGDFTTKIKGMVDAYNSAIQKSVMNGWASIAGSLPNSSAFDEEFYTYITGRYIGDPRSANPDTTATPEGVAQNIIDMRQATAGQNLGPLRDQVGACAAEKYCLGYTTLFNPLKPRLTDMLLATIAASTPGPVVQRALDAMECGLPSACGDVAKDPPMHSTCQDLDIHFNNLRVKGQNSPTLFVECLREKATALLGDNDDKDPKSPRPYTRLARAAIADFLFNYKISQEFPHDFLPYDLAQSAQALNASLSPFIDSFNEDLTAYQSFMRQQITDSPLEERGSWFGTDKPSFVNDGIITVRTLSAKETTVSTQTQNFLDATQQPSIATLISAISTSAATAKPSDLLPLPVQVLQAALGAVQSSKIQIGRSLSIDVTPRSQMGASAAEIDVNMKVDDVANPTYYAPGQTINGSSADVSRVAQHDTTTRVRVDSIKLFEISSFSAVLKRARPRFPVLPPFVELPYIGTLAGIPLPAAAEYHSSTAFLSAVVVPTATDIANEISFVTDRVFSGGSVGGCNAKSDANDPCNFELRKAESLSDLGVPIRDFHRAKVNCLAHNQPYSRVSTTTTAAPIRCEDLTFDQILTDAE